MIKRLLAKNSLTFNNLPATIDKLTKKKRGTSVVRAMTGRTSSSSRYSDQSRGAYVPARKTNKNYEPIQCRGYGTWGHKVKKCSTVPRISLAMRYINKNKNQTEALVKEHLRVNDKNVKRSTVRALQDSGVIDPNIDSMKYLQDEDIHVDMFEAEFDSNSE